MTVLGPRLGTLAGTLEAMPMCAYRAHVSYADSSEVLRLGRREEREAQGGSRHRVRGHRLPHRAWRPARHPGAPEPRPVRRPAHLRRPARGLRLPGAVRRGRPHGLPEDDHPEPEGDQEYSTEESDDEA